MHIYNKLTIFCLLRSFGFDSRTEVTPTVSVFLSQFINFCLFREPSREAVEDVDGGAHGCPAAE